MKSMVDYNLVVDIRGDARLVSFRRHYFAILHCLGIDFEFCEGSHWVEQEQIIRGLIANGGYLEGELFQIKFEGSLISCFDWCENSTTTQPKAEFLELYECVIGLCISLEDFRQDINPHSFAALRAIMNLPIVFVVGIFCGDGIDDSRAYLSPLREMLSKWESGYILGEKDDIQWHVYSGCFNSSVSLLAGDLQFLSNLINLCESASVGVAWRTTLSRARARGIQLWDSPIFDLPKNDSEFL